MCMEEFQEQYPHESPAKFHGHRVFLDLVIAVTSGISHSQQKKIVAHLTTNESWIHRWTNKWNGLKRISGSIFAINVDYRKTIRRFVYPARRMYPIISICKAFAIVHARYALRWCGISYSESIKCCVHADPACWNIFDVFRPHSTPWYRRLLKMYTLPAHHPSLKMPPELLHATLICLSEDTPKVVVALIYLISTPSRSRRSQTRM